MKNLRVHVIVALCLGVVIGAAACDGDSKPPASPSSAAGGAGGAKPVVTAGSSGYSGLAGSGGAGFTVKDLCKVSGGNPVAINSCNGPADFPDTCGAPASCAGKTPAVIYQCSCPVSMCFKAGTGCVAKP